MKLHELRPAYLARLIPQRLFHRAHPEVPVFVPAAVVLLDAWLRPSDRGFEFGSGRSTSWLAARVAHLITVEHDRRWYARFENRLRERGLGDVVDYRLIEAEGEQLDEPTDHPYATSIRELDDASLDFALVDGQMRLRCVQEAIPKIRPGGLLILDGANRYLPNRFEDGHSTIDIHRDEPLNEEWRDVLERLGDWRAMNTTDGLWNTRLWVRPG